MKNLSRGNRLFSMPKPFVFKTVYTLNYPLRCGTKASNSVKLATFISGWGIIAECG